MFYVKLNENGSVNCYPYTLVDLRRSIKNVSFPKRIDDSTAALFNCYPVRPSSPPEENYKVNIARIAIEEDGQWVEKWVDTPATTEQIAERTSAQAIEIRNRRNQLLNECDWTQLSDAPVDAVLWAKYRQALRDLTVQTEFPWKVNWPQEPA